MFQGYILASYYQSMPFNTRNTDCILSGPLASTVKREVERQVCPDILCWYRAKAWTEQMLVLIWSSMCGYDKFNDSCVSVCKGLSLFLTTFL